MAFKYEITISDPNKTRYTVPAALNAASDLTVLINSVEVANYTVQGEGPGSAQFDVIFDAAPVGQAGDTITFLRATATGRISDFSSGTSWTPDAFNQEFDNLHQIIDDVTGGVDVSTIDLGSIDTRLQAEEATSADHETRISTIEGQNLDPRVTALEANDTAQDATLANHEGRLDTLEDAAYQQTGLPDKTGKALQYLRVKADETGIEWDQASAADVANDSTAAGATVKDALNDHESRLDVAEPQIAANQANIAANQSAIAGKVDKSGDTMTNTLTVEVPSGVAESVITKAMASQDTVHRFRDSDNTNRGWVGFIRSSTPDYISIHNDNGPADMRVQDDGKVVLSASNAIEMYGDDFLVGSLPVSADPRFNIGAVNLRPALVSAYGEDDQSGSPVPIGTTKSFLFAVDLAALGLPSGQYLVEGVASFDTITGGTTHVQLFGRTLTGGTLGSIDWPSIADDASGQSPYAATKQGAGNFFNIPFAFKFTYANPRILEIRAIAGAAGEANYRRAAYKITRVGA